MGISGDTERTARRYRVRMVRALVREGLLADPRWRDAFAAVPRHLFLPRFFRPVGPNSWAAVDSTDPDWLAQVYANRVLVTQLDGDPSRWEAARLGGETRGVPTSSSSMPGIMAVMLDALNVPDGARVLEIGTGTGYNAALLCHRLGDGLVSTVDVDRSLVERARERLAGLGYQPECVAADGAGGHPAGAPYDRVLSTCSVSTVPLPWLAQTRPGGLVVTTLNRPLGAGLVRIVAGEGPCGRGRVLADDGRFMPLRAHREPVDDALIESLAHRSGLSRRTGLAAATVVSPTSPFEFFAGLALPHVVPASLGRATVVLHHRDGSWVRHRGDRGRHLVTQGGPRRLWDEVEKAYEQWCELGRPPRSRFGITVGPAGQELWLDHPASPYRWPLS
ncbi:MAG TPA: ATP-grasp peptide maturase system methyltransferase [Actinophytocola sp.]|uniref:ATP-grasp peptide maturase system methyltransferase n=1 Tax=Actinophytocola sp. TaxID=1872138 RepID=UPI002DDD1083|nr:ATP-grasp peptide maturase system methyltransferase [Actinophytocola sp.]HEV2782434.1 ATP-grasp peptide maturase system methyltransferase [Actinophytocola sp.]